MSEIIVGFDHIIGIKEAQDRLPAQPLPHRSGDGVGVGRVQVLAGLIDVSEPGILPGIVPGGIRIVSAEHPHRADSHERTIGLRLRVHHPAQQRVGAGVSDVEGVAFGPPSIGCGDGVNIEAMGHEGAGQGEGHFGIVRGLAGAEPKRPAVGKLPHPAGIVGGNGVGRGEFHQGTETVANDLAI